MVAVEDKLWKKNAVPQNLYAKSFHTLATSFLPRLVKQVTQQKCLLILMPAATAAAVVVFMPSIWWGPQNFFWWTRQCTNPLCSSIKQTCMAAAALYGQFLLPHARFLALSPPNSFHDCILGAKIQTVAKMSKSCGTFWIFAQKFQTSSISSVIWNYKLFGTKIQIVLFTQAQRSIGQLGNQERPANKG